MRTVVAVTEPLVAAGPNALTQSPTARSVAAALWVALTVVEPDVVTVSFWVLGVVGFLVFDVELDRPSRPKEPPESEIPETVRVEPVDRGHLARGDVEIRQGPAEIVGSGARGERRPGAALSTSAEGEPSATGAAGEATRWRAVAPAPEPGSATGAGAG